MGTAGIAALTSSGAVLDIVPAPPAPIAEGTSATTFEEIVDRHQAEIYRYAVQLTRDRMDANDLYQETVLRAYRAFGRLDGGANHRAWLYRIATNTFLSEWRRRARLTNLDTEAVREITAPTVDHDAGLDARDVLRSVQELVDGLPPKLRAALMLRKYHEPDYAQIAVALQCSEGAARASVYQALRKLRECLGDASLSLD